MFTAGVILAIMILPIVTSISREILVTVPRELRDGAYALGATRYEVIRGVALPFSRAGIVGASLAWHLMRGGASPTGRCVH